MYAWLHNTIRNDAENEKQKRHNDEVLYIFHIRALCDKTNRDNEDEAMIAFLLAENFHRRSYVKLMHIKYHYNCYLLLETDMLYALLYLWDFDIFYKSYRIIYKIHEINDKYNTFIFDLNQTLNINKNIVIS